MRNIILLGSLICILAGCNDGIPPSPVESNASLCEIMRERLSADEYRHQDLATMKRKNVVDTARQLKEYEYYSCPEIVDDAPPPDYPGSIP